MCVFVCVCVCVCVFTVDFNSCTSPPDICQCLVVQKPTGNMSNHRQSSSASLRIKATSNCHPCVRAKETGWPSGVRSCIMPGLSTHSVQELNIGTLGIPKVDFFLIFLHRYSLSIGPVHIFCATNTFMVMV